MRRDAPAADVFVVSSKRYNPAFEALMNFPDACCRKDFTCSAADFEMGTVYCAA
jgi:hypothetical protein